MKKAFTLAEIFITLVVIGVIAAFVIPNLVTNLQDAQLKTAWKKAYSDLTQATSRVVADNGGTMIGLCDDNDYGCAKLNNEYKTYFGYVKSCTDPSGQGCWHDANEWFYLNHNNQCSGGGSAGALDNCPARSLGGNYRGLILSNGSLLHYIWFSSSCNSTITSGAGVKCGFLSVDINGFKIPNMVGKDIFAAWITANGLKAVGTPNADGYLCTLMGWGCSAAYLKQ